MTPDQINALAKQAGGTAYVNHHYPGETGTLFGWAGALEEFVRLVREQAFEEAAQVVKAELFPNPRGYYKEQYNFGIEQQAYWALPAGSTNEFTIFHLPKPVGYWVLYTEAPNPTKFSMYHRPTDEQIKNTEQMLGWKWSEQ